MQRFSFQKLLLLMKAFQWLDITIFTQEHCRRFNVPLFPPQVFAACCFPLEQSSSIIAVEASH